MVLEQIRTVYPALTRSQKLVADLIATSYREVAFMTASTLAERLDLNEATVVRFAQRLGYDGYPSLIERIRDMVHEELRAEGAAAEPGGATPSLLQTEAWELSRASVQVSDGDLHKAGDMLVSARRTIALGQGYAGPLAMLLAASLHALGLAAESPFADGVSLALVLTDVAEGDVVVAISATWDSPELARALARAASRGARTLAIASSPVSLCSQQAEVSLSVPIGAAYTVKPLAPLCLLIDAVTQTVALALRKDPREEARRVSATRADILSAR